MPDLNSALVDWYVLSFHRGPHFWFVTLPNIPGGGVLLSLRMIILAKCAKLILVLMTSSKSLIHSIVIGVAPVIRILSKVIVPGEDWRLAGSIHIGIIVVF